MDSCSTNGWIITVSICSKDWRTSAAWWTISNTIAVPMKVSSEITVVGGWKLGRGWNYSQGILKWKKYPRVQCMRRQLQEVLVRYWRVNVAISIYSHRPLGLDCSTSYGRFVEVYLPLRRRYKQSWPISCSNMYKDLTGWYSSFERACSIKIRDIY